MRSHLVGRPLPDPEGGPIQYSLVSGSLGSVFTQFGTDLNEKNLVINILHFN